MTSSVSRSTTGLTLRANFSWTFVGNTVNAAAWFAMTIVLAKLGSPEHVGQFAIGLATTAPVFMFATLRLRDIQAVDTRQEYRFEDYFGLRICTTGLALLTVLCIAVLGPFERDTALIILATGLSKAIEATSDVYYGLFMQQERLDRIAKSLMIKGPLSLIGLGVGYYLTGSVFWGVIGLAAARAVMMVVYDLRNAALSLRPGAAGSGGWLPHGVPRPRWNRAILGRLARLALPLGFVTMLISFNANIPRYFIEHTIGAHYLGLFAAVASFQKVAPTVIQALGRSASPRLAKYYAADNIRLFRLLTLRLVGIGGLLGGAGIVAALLLGRPLLTWFYGPEYAMPRLFALIMLGAGLDYIATMLLFVITSARYFRVQLPLQLITSGIVALACFWLIPRFGLEGAAVALAAGNTARVIGTAIVAWHAQRMLAQRVGSPQPQRAAHPAA